MARSRWPRGSLGQTSRREGYGILFCARIMPVSALSDLDSWTPEDYRRELYRAGYEFAAGKLADGLDPARVRAEYAALAAGSVWPFSAESRRGVEDAIEERRAEASLKVDLLATRTPLT